MVTFIGTFPRISNYKDIWNRVINIYSGGKTFSCTGWRIGWAIGPKELINPLKEKQELTSGQTSGPLMEIMSKALDQAPLPYLEYSSYYEYLEKSFTKRKDMILEGLSKSKLNLNIVPPEGGHFIMADIKETIKIVPLSYFYKESSDAFATKKNQFIQNFEEWTTLESDYKPDEAVCNYLTIVYGITPIPCNPFFDPNELEDENDACRYIRFAICKKNEDVQ